MSRIQKYIYSESYASERMSASYDPIPIIASGEARRSIASGAISGAAIEQIILESGRESRLFP